MKKTKSIAWSALLKHTLLGVTIGLLTSMIVCAIGAALVSGGSLEEASMGYIATAALLLGSVVGGWIASGGREIHSLIACGAYGLCWFLVLLCVGTLLFEDGLQGAGVTALLCIGSSLGVGFVKMRGTMRRGRGKRRYKIH